MADDFPVVLTAGSLREDPRAGWLVPHAWTDAGVVVQAAPNGAGVLHVAVALCVGPFAPAALAFPGTPT